MYNSKFVKPENKRGQYKCCSYQHCVILIGPSLLSVNIGGIYTCKQGSLPVHITNSVAIPALCVILIGPSYIQSIYAVNQVISL